MRRTQYAANETNTTTLVSDCLGAGEMPGMQMLEGHGWRTLKSTPMVAGWSVANESSVKRRRMLDFPTPLYPQKKMRKSDAERDGCRRVSGTLRLRAGCGQAGAHPEFKSNPRKTKPAKQAC
eukprot:2293152-Rhodomonas_salina.2